MLDRAIRRTRFDSERVQSHAVGGGIIPVARRADGTVCLLLAKEQHVPSWKGSFKWSGFEGGRKAHETIEETSVREWREESLDSVVTVGVDDLRQQRYVCRFTLNIVPYASSSSSRQASSARSPTRVGNEHDLDEAYANESTASSSRPDRYHVTYLVEVPYVESYTDIFSQRRRQLLAVRDAAAALHSATLSCTGMQKPLVDFVITETSCRFFFSNDATVVFDAPFSKGVQTWIAVHEELVQKLQDVDTSAAVTVYRTTNNEVLTVEVLPDFLEKERLRWWTLAELRQVLLRGGRMQDEVFRTYFLPVLQGLVSFLVHNEERRRGRAGLRDGRGSSLT